MRALWHHSRQRKTDAPVDSRELHRLVGLGLIGPTDLIRHSGSRRGAEAARVEGLFNAHEQRWYVSRAEGLCGPVTLDGLLGLAKQGQLRPGDLIWRPGMGRCKRADRIVGLFPAAAPPATPPGQAEGRALPRPSDATPTWRGLVGMPPGGDRPGCGSVDTACDFPSDDHVLGKQGRPRRPRAGRPEDPVRADPRVARPSSSATVVLDVGTLAVVLAAGNLPAFRVSPRSSLADREKAGGRPIPTNGPVQGGLDQEPGSSKPGTQGPLQAEYLPRGGDEAPDTLPTPPGLSPEEATRVGSALHELIVGRHEVDDDATSRDRLARAAAPLLPPDAGKAREITFTILGSDEAFAFSHPGGYIYVSSGLLRFVRNEVALQFQLARELAHLELGHLADSAATHEASLTVERRLYRQIALGYSDDQVFAADGRAFLRLRGLGHAAYRLLACLSLSYDFHGAADPRGSRRGPASDPSDDRQDVENHWHAHPPASLRFARLRSLESTGFDS